MLLSAEVLPDVNEPATYSTFAPQAENGTRGLGSWGNNEHRPLRITSVAAEQLGNLHTRGARLIPDGGAAAASVTSLALVASMP